MLQLVRLSPVNNKWMESRLSGIPVKALSRVLNYERVIFGKISLNNYITIICTSLQKREIVRLGARFKMVPREIPNFAA